MKSAGHQRQVDVGLLDFDQACQRETQGFPVGGDTAERCSGLDQLLKQEVRLVFLADHRVSAVQQPEVGVILHAFSKQLQADGRHQAVAFRNAGIKSDRVFYEYHVAVVKIAAQYLNARGCVMIGDVVSLGKTLMVTALTKICEYDLLMDSLII